MYVLCGLHWFAAIPGLAGLLDLLGLLPLSGFLWIAGLLATARWFACDCWFAVDCACLLDWWFARFCGPGTSAGEVLHVCRRHLRCLSACLAARNGRVNRMSRFCVGAPATRFSS